MLGIYKKETMEAEAEIEKAVRKTAAEFREDVLSKTLTNTSMPDGRWKPVDIIEFLLSGKKPVSAVSAIAGRDCRERGGLEQHLNVRKHSACRLDGFITLVRTWV